MTLKNVDSHKSKLFMFQIKTTNKYCNRVINCFILLLNIESWTLKTLFLISVKYERQAKSLIYAMLNEVTKNKIFIIILELYYLSSEKVSYII